MCKLLHIQVTQILNRVKRVEKHSQKSFIEGFFFFCLVIGGIYFLQLIQIWYLDCSQTHFGNASKCKWSRIIERLQFSIEYCKGVTMCAVDMPNTQKSRLQPCISIRRLFVFLIEPWQSALRGELYTHSTMSSSNKPITSTAHKPQQSRQIACVPWGNAVRQDDKLRP